MKITVKLLGLATVLFLSSCATDMLVLKRKYNTGYYVSTGSKTNHQYTAPEKIMAKEIATETEQLSSTSETTEMPVTASADNSIAPIVKSHFPLITRVQKTESNSTHAALTYSAKEQKRNEKIEKKTEKAATKMVKKQKRAGADTDLILLVILSLFPFINLIAMYLKDGSKITMNFWICLLLNCLFFVPGIIFALLVVFDVISLA